MELKYYKIEWKEDFKEELDNICEYLNFMSKSDVLSDRLILNVYRNVNTLSSSPEMYPVTGIRDREEHEYRKMVVDKRYIVLYYIDYDDRIVYIAHIFDGRSNYLERLV